MGAQAFFCASVTALAGSVAFVINPLLGIAVWIYGVRNLATYFRARTSSNETLAARRAVEQEWNTRWARWGGRPAHR